MDENKRQIISENYVGTWVFDDEDLSTPAATARELYAGWEKVFADEGGVQGFSESDLEEYLREQAERQDVIVTEVTLSSARESADQQLPESICDDGSIAVNR